MNPTSPQQTNAFYNELINAIPSNAASDDGGPIPVGWAPVPGTYVNNSTGLLGQTFYNPSTGQIIIALQGSNFVTPFGTPVENGAQTADGQILQGVPPKDYNDALNDYVNNTVIPQANAALGINYATLDQFNAETTGHSLGAYGAAYLAAGTGIRGTGYGSTGVPGLAQILQISGAPGGDTFVNYGFSNDVIGQFGVGSGVVYPQIPSIGLGPTPSFYGQFQLLGNPATQAQIQNDLNTIENAASGLTGVKGLDDSAAASVDLFVNIGLSHLSYAGFFSSGVNNRSSLSTERSLLSFD